MTGGAGFVGSHLAEELVARGGISQRDAERIVRYRSGISEFTPELLSEVLDDASRARELSARTRPLDLQTANVDLAAFDDLVVTTDTEPLTAANLVFRDDFTDGRVKPWQPEDHTNTNGPSRWVEAGGALGGVGDKIDDVYFEIDGARGGPTEFLGYDTVEAAATLRAIVRDGARVEAAREGETVELVFERTPFYGESGGQIGDTGVVEADGVRARVTDTKKPAGLIVHQAVVELGELGVGAALQLRVDVGRRDAIRRNHSATHMLHHALRDVLGTHVTQKGSLVAPDRLRFDFSHPRPVTAQEREAIERSVNAMVVANAATGTREMSLAEAKQAGAIGLFGEKYGDEVRVVTIAADSVELCGGTHVARAGDVGLFKIVSEGGVAQGVRRVEAVTGTGAVDWVQHVAGVLDEAAAKLHARDADDVLVRLRKLQDDLEAREREVAQLKRKLATGGAGGGDAVAEVGGVKLLTRKIGVADPKVMRDAADTLRDRLGSGVVVLAAERDGKAVLLVAVTKDLAGKTVHAGKLVGALAAHVDGRGGGRPDLAQAGGPNTAGLDAAIADAAAQLQAQLG